MENKRRLQKLLKELFQFDNADLDFGIYRIMNQKRDEIEFFINNELINFIEKELSQIESNDKEDLEVELEKVKEEASHLGFDYTQSPKYISIKEKMAQYKIGENLESEIYNDVYTFFKRYYDNGDFLSKRRYSSKDKYAIPYNGEEVHLHWANYDQYYIKTSEEFNNYSFKKNNITVNFKIINAEVEKNNNKSDEDRYFVLKEKDYLKYDEKLKILNINFEYRNLTSKEKKKYKTRNTQADIREYIEKDISNKIKKDTEFFQDLSWLLSDNNKVKSILAKHLYKYTIKNKSDYFIHKDLKSFLERELDFFIKNEILDVDAIGSATERNISTYITRVKVIKAVIQKIINFLAQIENFQKKLFEKKKFVLQDEYCLTLDRVPEKIRKNLLIQVLNNEDQIMEWQNLYNEKISKKEDLYINDSSLFDKKSFKKLVIDTRHYDQEFKEELLAAFDNLEKEIEGLMINSENFQALSLMLEKYKGKVKCIYIDPPYNTGGDDFVYKDNYQHSSWLSMMENRLELAKRILSDDGILFINIDDNEVHNLRKICDKIFGEDNFLANVVWKHTQQSKNDEVHFSRHYNSLVVYGKNMSMLSKFRFKRTEEDNKNYSNPDNDPKGKWRRGDVRSPNYRRTLCYKIKTPSGNTILPPDNGWRWSEETLNQKISTGEIIFDEDETKIIRKIYLQEQDGRTPENVWEGEEYGTSRAANTELKDLFNGEVLFDTPKPTNLIKKIMELIHQAKNYIILDFFAGSGTTGHACLDMNMEDNGNRKYIQVELGNYFYSIILPRIKKVMYSQEWKDGKPQDNEGYSHFFKYQRLEQYEDTLDNIHFAKEKEELNLFNKFDDYLIKYMLDYETRNSLLDIDQFTDPFNYSLEITENKEKIKKKVNLVETFNYLLGLDVKQNKIYNHQDRKYKVISGKKDTQEIMVIWRNTEDLDLEKDKEFIEKEIIKDQKIDKLYLNGDNYLKNAILIEDQFSNLLFD